MVSDRNTPPYEGRPESDYFDLAKGLARLQHDNVLLALSFLAAADAAIPIVKVSTCIEDDFATPVTLYAAHSMLHAGRRILEAAINHQADAVGHSYTTILILNEQRLEVLRAIECLEALMAVGGAE